MDRFYWNQEDHWCGWHEYTVIRLCRGARDLRERILVFTCPEEPEWDKSKLLTFFAKHLASALDRVDYENIITRADSASLNVNENSASVFDKAARFATKTRHKVGRALSLNRTPSKIKRTMSQMISPFTSYRQRPDPDSISQMSSDSPPPLPPPKHLAFGKWSIYWIQVSLLSLMCSCRIKLNDARTFYFKYRACAAIVPLHVRIDVILQRNSLPSQQSNPYRF